MIRRLARFALTLGLLAPASPGVSADRVVVVCNCGLEAYQEAIDGIRDALGRAPDVVNLEAGGAAALQLKARDATRVFIVLGRDALHSLAVARPAGPVFSAMMLHRDAEEEKVSLAGEIDLDAPTRQVFSGLRRLFPRKSRLGVLVSANADRADLLARGREAGFAAVEFAEAGGPQELLRAFASLRGRVDLVLTLPDGGLYNSATVKPLILASLDHRLPVVGFSAAFVRAGAAAGVFADFREAGRQAADAALRYDSNHAQRPAEQPRKLKLAVNQRVLRLLGLDYEHSGEVEVYR